MALESMTLDADDWTSFALLQATIDGLPDPVFVKDRQHRWIAFNAAFCRLLGRTREELLGRSDPDLFPPEQVEVFWRGDDAVFASEGPLENEELLLDGSGVTHTIWTRKFPLRNARGEAYALCGIITDVTAFRERVRRLDRIEAENKEQQATIAAQTALLDALMMPVVEVWEGVLLLSLVGELSERRATRAMEELLAAITRTRARSVLIDLTGVPLVDTAVAGALQRTTRAAGLLGCESVLCGIGPSIAQALVQLDIDLGRAAVCGSVRDGLARALGRPRR